MTFVVKCGVMKVGNSTVMVLPKVLTDNYKIKKGKKLRIFCTDNGIIIKVEKQNGRNVSNE